MGEGDIKPRPEWARERNEKWKKSGEAGPSEQEIANQARAFQARKAKLPHPSSAGMDRQDESEGYRFAAKLNHRVDSFERVRGLGSLKKERGKVRDRLLKMRIERAQRMRSNKKRIEEKKDVPASERVRRINVLLRARVYDKNSLEDLPDSPQKREMEPWIDALSEGEQKRLYVIGRKKIEFKIKREDYPDLSDEEFEKEKLFQEEQKELADALEVTAIPMLRGVFQSLGKNVDVYLTSPNDDLAGGIDVAIDFLKPDGQPELFPDGKPLRLMVDMTYARMWNKIDKEVARGRVCDEVYAILKGNSKSVPEELSNARAMKLFRTVVETLGGTMSMQTFDKNRLMDESQKHIPRLIIGLDWGNAFSSISNWVAKDDDFEDWFKDTGLARRIALSIKNQLIGLHRLAAQDSSNPNLPYLKKLIDHIDTGMLLTALTPDQSLGNIDRLLTTDNAPLKSWQRNRLYHAALAQIKYGKPRAYARGDRRSGALATGKLKYYNGGITGDMLEKDRVEMPPIEMDPDSRAGKLAKEINDIWKKTRINANGERVVMSKKEKEETFWGDWLSEKLSRTYGWSDKEKAYVRQNLPQNLVTQKLDTVDLSKQNKVADARQSIVKPMTQQTEAEKIRRRLMVLELYALRRRIAQQGRKKS